LNLKQSAAKKIIEARGLNSALPFCILSKDGDLLCLNARMQELLLGFKSGSKKSSKIKAKTIATPLPYSELLGIWPFFDETQGPPAFLSHVLHQKSRKKPSVLFGEGRLKTFKFHVLEFQEGELKGQIVVTEMMRSGDLLQDRHSRQVLFRSMSHEIRTAVMALQGYASILKGEYPEAQVIYEGLRQSMSRLDNVVKRLDEFRLELEVLDEG
jgi:signal transduction histidine kinase